MSSWIGDGDEGAAGAFGTVDRRRQILRVLSTGSLSKVELVHTLSVSRSTVDRDAERLVRLDLVERSNGRFVVISADRVALETHGEAIRVMANVLDAVPAFDHPPESVEPPPSLFRRAVVYTGDLSEMGRRAPPDFDINEVTEFAGFNGPFLFSNWPEACEQLTRLGDGVALVLFAKSLDWLSNCYPNDFDAMVDAGARVAAVSEDPTFGVVIMNRPTTAPTALVVYDRVGIPEVLVMSYEPSAVAWSRGFVAARAKTAHPYRPDE